MSSPAPPPPPLPPHGTPTSGRCNRSTSYVDCSPSLSKSRSSSSSSITAVSSSGGGEGKALERSKTWERRDPLRDITNTYYDVPFELMTTESRRDGRLHRVPTPSRVDPLLTPSTSLADAALPSPFSSLGRPLRSTRWLRRSVTLGATPSTAFTSSSFSSPVTPTSTGLPPRPTPPSASDEALPSSPTRLVRSSSRRRSHPPDEASSRFELRSMSRQGTSPSASRSGGPVIEPLSEEPDSADLNENEAFPTAPSLRRTASSSSVASASSTMTLSDTSSLSSSLSARRLRRRTSQSESENRGRFR
ncbi:BZ3500_MvSof-1268-A1-R1_Chr6-3g08738 [Microbotryum saponariae]|uniref:BZ3500_MvSof-1268-A1-R1_Chr6-3g08738 protein n=1 Tax=Microbotryum saponariae TaxID=289078 RepID=A0A2X0LMX7_9BASI|nr:BZ3500_MvSof-1268-A1-R1_Chr6-3g08738 [Microbotryum saponariae]SDA07339.1 BZ3501_MvSof-1269-A2-R1_Chr6-2g08441 [Microbotryum saponariae]